MNINAKKARVLVAMSGGVDSSVAAKLLKDRGYDAAGIFLRFWKEPGSAEENKCCSDQALTDARRVAGRLGIRLYVLNFSALFKKLVVDEFLRAYASGQTPNPCVVCNKKVKLGYLLRQAKRLGFDYVATGHYAVIKRGGRTCQLLKAKDKNKDQSYFLYSLAPAELKHLLFPLGGFTKDQVRTMAKKFRLSVADKPDSQEICFVAGKNHNDFLRRHLKLRPGEIKTLDGRTLGWHGGLPLYTIGQRKGIEIGGGGPYYAIKLDYKKNVLYVTDEPRDANLYRRSFAVKKLNWLDGAAPRLPLTCRVVIRYRHAPVACRLIKGKAGLAVKLARPQRAITPGQSAVFYRGQQVLGGGVIA